MCTCKMFICAPARGESDTHPGLHCPHHSLNAHQVIVLFVRWMMMMMTVMMVVRLFNSLNKKLCKSLRERKKACRLGHYALCFYHLWSTARQRHLRIQSTYEVHYSSRQPHIEAQSLFHHTSSYHIARLHTGWHRWLHYRLHRHLST